MRRATYLNGILTANAVLLSALVADRLLDGGESGLAGLASPAPAVAAGPRGAQPAETGGLLSAGDQRKMMITELRRIAQRLDQVESRLNAGVNVKVTDMPELKLPRERETAGSASGAGAPAATPVVEGREPKVLIREAPGTR